MRTPLVLASNRKPYISSFNYINALAVKDLYYDSELDTNFKYLEIIDCCENYNIVDMKRFDCLH